MISIETGNKHLTNTQIYVFSCMELKNLSCDKMVLFYVLHSIIQPNYALTLIKK